MLPAGQPPVDWVEGIAIMIAILIVIGHFLVSSVSPRHHNPRLSLALSMTGKRNASSRYSTKRRMSGVSRSFVMAKSISLTSKYVACMVSHLS